MEKKQKKHWVKKVPCRRRKDHTQQRRRREHQMKRADSFCDCKEDTKMKYAENYQNNNIIVLKTVHKFM